MQEAFLRVSACNKCFSEDVHATKLLWASTCNRRFSKVAQAINVPLNLFMQHICLWSCLPDEHFLPAVHATTCTEAINVTISFMQ